MKQFEAVMMVMEGHRGYATLGFLNQNVPKVEGCQWKTKTPFASIRRIVQDERFFFKIRPGLWALKSHKDRLPPEILPSKVVPGAQQAEYNHTYYQGLLVEVGNFKKYETFVPSQDKNKAYLGKKLLDIATMHKMCEFGFDHMVRVARTIDVAWFNERKMPTALFEVEHSTAISNSLLKFVELRDFNTDFCIVADKVRKREFEVKLSMGAFQTINKRVGFWSYDDLAELHSRTSEFAGIELKLAL